MRLVGFKVLTSEVAMSCNLWFITPCIPLEVNGRFRSSYRFHLQCQEYVKQGGSFKSVANRIDFVAHKKPQVRIQV
jgi:hypothetical protein